MSDASTTGPLPGLPGFFPRPPYQLTSHSPRMRWELTRRHPYYSHWWKIAKLYYETDEAQDEEIMLFAPCAVKFLAWIGVSGPPVDPALEFEEIGSPSAGSDWLSGAVQPMTLRGMGNLLIASAPKPVLQYLSVILWQASQDDKPDEQPAKPQAMEDLSKSGISQLDDLVAEPFVAITPSASITQVKKDISALMQRWKKERGLKDERDRSDKYGQYLKVWDLREGWKAGVYDRSCEHNFDEIAKHYKKPVSSVSNHYRLAFELITGYAYSPAMWERFMGMLKLSELFAESASDHGRVSKSRPLVSPSRRPVPESALASGSGEGDRTFLISGLEADAVDSTSKRIEKIKTMIENGLADEAIAEQLELSNKALPAIACLRARSGKK